MPELSQVVRQRLASRGPAGDHPDADTLTAYTEKLLSLSEGRLVLEHLATCADCREIVALSLPEARELLPAPAVAAPRRRGGWRWRPALGLAASLATLAVVATLVVELPRKPATFESRSQQPAPSPEQAGKTTAAPASTQPESLAANGLADQVRPAPSRTAAASASGAGANAANYDVTLHAAAAPPPAVSVTTASVTSSRHEVAEAKLNERDYVNKQMFVAGQTSNEAVPAVADLPVAPLPHLAQNQFPPPVSSNVPLTFADLPPQMQNGKVLRSRQLSNPPNNHFGSLIPNLPALGRKAETLARRSLAIQPGALTFSAMESGALAPSREDQVQSADAKDKAAAGDLDQSSAFSPRALTGGGASSAAAWKVSGGILLKSTDSTAWNPGYGAGDIEFTVVAAHGANVWAGGTNAALVHSVNGGASWERVTLGSSASGSITSIEFAAANVHVKSSSGQEWSSQDAGRTWSMDK